MGVTITLPESLKAFIDAEVASGGYADASGYVQELLLKEERKQNEHARIEALLEEGLNSGEARTWTASDSEFLRHELQRRFAKGREIKADFVIHTPSRKCLGPESV